jgi:hypothetical protein
MLCKLCLAGAFALLAAGAADATTTTEYPSVHSALQALRARPGVVFSTKNGWTDADDEATNSIWSFAPSNYPAYPAVVKRQFIQEGGQFSIRVTVQCGASKLACDDLRQWFSKNLVLPK